MLQCCEGSVWLILDTLCPCGTVACRWPKVWQISAAEPRQNQGCLHSAHQAWYCWTISFPPYGSNEWCYNVVKALCGWFWTHHVPVALSLAKSLADFSQSQANTRVVCTQHTKHGTAEPFHLFHMGPMSDVTMVVKALCGWFLKGHVLFSYLDKY
jgi:hypothetical protein